jgi:hypothetical protein
MDIWNNIMSGGVIAVTLPQVWSSGHNHLPAGHPAQSLRRGH